MACYSPWFDARATKGARRLLSCGKCIGCRLEYSRQWAVRMYHESQLHDLNCFLTLTYAETGFSLVPRDFTLFMKRLRARTMVPTVPLAMDTITGSVIELEAPF